MKKFETPEVNVVTFAAEDVITTSASAGNGSMLPDDEL